VNNSVFDVGMMVGFGVVGYLLRKFAFPPAPLILAMILGPMLERTLQQSLIASGGEPLVFLQRPISAALLSAAGLLMLTPAVKWVWKSQLARKPE
jgi:putative tricarboxylic transport membrane protein